MRSSKWWAHELERRERQYAAERAQLVATICHLAGKPLPAADTPEPAATDDEAPAFVIPDFLPE